MNVPVYTGNETPRGYVISRKTKETDISLSVCLDGGEVKVDTSIGFFDHMLTALAFYAGFGLDVKAVGDLEVDAHHTVEDVGIVLGRAFAAALKDNRGIARFGAAFVPMDEALCRVVLDISNRPYLVYEAEMPQAMIGSYDACLTEEFMRAFSMNSGITLHMNALYGRNAHHITEALFKALGLALKQAVKVEGDRVVSTKGVL
ncbi:imidazoleglycerol-phosphate dehydratase HisB [Vermiculatibacterium agrestimuris]|uniref:imidazoleglycerol-phosphate dehydratase HisB n=1 Tax=Vermiculatibacterium agrestimuris TaxID=2941519 RepID=UPI00203B3C3C|nr:imidazoleglycerol-phosphate dehydratase HisB [Vermiculatibacterium agrestimuris]